MTHAFATTEAQLQVVVAAAVGAGDSVEAVVVVDDPDVPGDEMEVQNQDAT